MQLEQDILIEEWITSRNQAILALRAAHITAVDIASIRCGDASAQSWQVLEIGDQTRLDRFIPLGDPLRELIISYSAGRPDSNATHLFVDRQGIALTVEQIAEIGAGTKLPKRWRPVSRAVANTPVPPVDCVPPAPLLAYTESSPAAADKGALSHTGVHATVEGRVGGALLDVAVFPRNFAAAAEAWANQLVSEGKATATISCYERAIRRLVAELSEILRTEITLEKFRTLDRELVECWRSRSLDSGVSAATIDQLLAAMRSFVRFIIGPRAAAPSALSVTRTRATPLPTTIAASETVHDVIRAEQSSGEETWITRRQHAIAALIADVGATATEISAATRSCLRLAEQSTIVLAAHTIRQRVIELTPGTADLIACYLAACPFELSDSQPLFVSQEGSPVSSRVLLQGMHRLADKFGLPDDINARSVRRGAISSMYDAGLCDFEIAERLKISSLEGVSQVLRETGRVSGPPVVSVREKHSTANGTQGGAQRAVRAFMAWCVEDEALTYHELAAWERVLKPLLDGSIEAANPEAQTASELVQRYLDQLRSRLNANYRVRQRVSRIMLLFSTWVATPDRTKAQSRAHQNGPRSALPAFLSSLLQDSDLTLGTVANYGLDVTRFTKFLSDNALEIGNAQPRDVAAYIENLAASGAKQATTRRALAAIRRFFDWAESAGHLIANPAKASMIHLRKGTEPSVEPPDDSNSLSPDAADVLINALSDRGSEVHLCTALIASFASNEGLELREILSLRRSAVIDTNQSIASAIVINRQDIELSSRTRQLLARYAAQELVQGDGALIRASSLGARSGSLFRQTVAGHLKASGQAVGFPRVNLRALRTSFVSRLLRTGLDYELVRRRARLAHIDQVVRSVPDRALSASSR